MELEIDVSFDKFWEAYPRKTDKAKAKRKFSSLSDANKHNAIAGARYHAEHNPQWKNPSLIPHATTYLNGKRWEDEVVEDLGAKERVINSEATNKAELVWQAMVQMFGKAWIDKHGEKPSPVWVSQLANIEEPRLKRGLRKTLDAGSEFPPSLPKFVEYCARTFGEQHPEQKKLEPPRDPTVALDALKEMKSILGVK